MAQDGVHRQHATPALSHRTALLMLGLLTAAAGGAAAFVEMIDPRMLLPWIALPMAAIAWQFRRPAAVDLFDPFTFLSWTHYAPVYVVGALLLAVGIVGYPYASLVDDPVAACVLALLYTVIGYLALGLGCRWSGARALGTRLAQALPPPPTRTIPLGAIVMLAILGAAASYSAFRAGIIGFAVPRPPGPLDAAATYAAVLLSLAHFLFWFRWFDPEQARPPRIALFIPALIVLFAMTIAGNRGSLLAAYLVAALAYGFARGRVTLRQSIVVVALAFVALSVGMVYGTMFRMLKGGETNVSTHTGGASPSLSNQLEVAAFTARSLTSGDTMARVTGILAAGGQRLNILSDASVAIARYPELRPLEQERGVADLWTMTWTGVVPRVLWPGKPMVGNARAYSALYFNEGGNSFAWTPPTDLIRNVGPLLMPVGMALIGMLVGALAVALATPGTTAVGERAALFSLLLVNLNLEGSFGLILPTMVRIAAVVLIGLLVVRVWSGRAKRVAA